MNMTLPTPVQIKEKKYYQPLGLSDNEFSQIEAILGRTPNYTEMALFSAMWSEHCSYKNSKVVLRKFPTDGPHVLQGPGEGAGVVDIGDGQAVVFKMESHNHPSAIEPYQGAATGAGGIIRDVFSMGAKPIALLDSLRFGELDDNHVKYLFEHVIAGISGYGNCIGIPTVGGEVQFDDCYAGNPLVNVMCVGLIDHENIQQGKAAGKGNTVMYVGAATGRDGIHGASFASTDLSDESESKKSAVQVGDPFMEKLLLEACLEVVHFDSLVGIQDMGAAGLTSASAEMASKAGMGMELNLDLVPQRESQMNAFEMMLSESQERMLIVVEKGKETAVKDLFEKYDLQAQEIGQVTDDKILRLNYRGETVAEVPVDALAEDSPAYHKPDRQPEYFADFQARDTTIEKITDYNYVLKKLLEQPTIADKHWVYEQYDYQVQTNTVVTPGSDAAVLRIRGTDKALAMSTDCNSRYIYLDPDTGGQIAVAEAARNIVCSGGKPLAVTDCLNFGNPENPEVFWQIQRSVEGMSAACRTLETPVIGGNVSLYNERSGQAIYPTPTIGMVGLISELDHITTQEFKHSGDRIYLIGQSGPDFGGSEIQKMLSGKIFGPAPKIDIEVEKTRQQAITDAISAGLVNSAHDLSEGGLAVGLAECLIQAQKGLGAEITVDQSVDIDSELFAETQSRFVISVDSEHASELEKIIPEAQFIGTVNDSMKLRVRQSGSSIIDMPVDELSASWKGAIECLLN